MPLPRLGSAKANSHQPQTREVELPDRGVSLLLKRPTVETVLDLQDQISDEETAREGFRGGVALIARMLVEPAMSEEDFRKEAESWAYSDWELLQDVAMEFAGMRREVESAASAEFQA